MKNCDQFRELIEAYALGALDLEDRAALEAHLATGCADCAKAVEEARWLVSQLAYTAPQAAPSDMLKGRLMQTVRAEAEAQTKPRVMPGKSAIPFWLTVQPSFCRIDCLIAPTTPGPGYAKSAVPSCQHNRRYRRSHQGRKELEW